MEKLIIISVKGYTKENVSHTLGDHICDDGVEVLKKFYFNNELPPLNKLIDIVYNWFYTTQGNEDFEDNNPKGYMLLKLFMETKYLDERDGEYKWLNEINPTYGVSCEDIENYILSLEPLYIPYLHEEE